MDIQFNLRERTVIIAGPFSSTLQNMMIGLTQLGADVAFLDKEANQATKFCQNITDQREVNEKQGRAMAVQTDLTDRKQLKEAVSKIAQTFGSIDIYIDAHLHNQPSPMLLIDDETDLDAILTKNLKIPLMLTQNIIGYLKGRKRGRILYLVNQPMIGGATSDLLGAAARTGLIQFAKTFARQIHDLNVTVNVLSVGLTEEYVLGHFPEAGSIKEAVEKLKAQDPTFKITEPDKITHSVVYLVSQFGNAVSGQTITLT
jgi:NAD(P)-dependent dehydrogenase (short-subunit alcohol dehydrogenase family)